MLLIVGFGIVCGRVCFGGCGDWKYPCGANPIFCVTLQIDFERKNIPNINHKCCADGIPHSLSATDRQAPLVERDDALCLDVADVGIVANFVAFGTFLNDNNDGGSGG